MTIATTAVTVTASASTTTENAAPTVAVTTAPPASTLSLVPRPTQPAMDPSQPAQPRVQTNVSAPQDSAVSTTQIYIIVGVAVGVLLVAMLAVYLFRRKTRASPRFKSRLDNAPKPPPHAAVHKPDFEQYAPAKYDHQQYELANLPHHDHYDPAHQPQQEHYMGPQQEHYMDPQQEHYMDTQQVYFDTSNQQYFDHHGNQVYFDHQYGTDSQYYATEPYTYPVDPFNDHNQESDSHIPHGGFDTHYYESTEDLTPHHNPTSKEENSTNRHKAPVSQAGYSQKVVDHYVEKQV